MIRIKWYVHAEMPPYELAQWQSALSRDSAFEIEEIPMGLPWYEGILQRARQEEVDVVVMPNFWIHRLWPASQLLTGPYLIRSEAPSLAALGLATRQFGEIEYDDMISDALAKSDNDEFSTIPKYVETQWIRLLRALVASYRSNHLLVGCSVIWLQSADPSMIAFAVGRAVAALNVQPEVIRHPVGFAETLVSEIV